MEALQPVLQHWDFYLIGLIGALVHYGKKRFKGEVADDTLSGWLDHFTTNFTGTLGLVGSYTAAYYVLVQAGDPTVPAVIAIGYTCDSAFNKSFKDKNNDSSK